MRTKIAVALLLLASIVLFPLQRAFAEGNLPPITPSPVTSPSRVTFQDLITEYNLRAVDKVPTGVVPLKFSSPAELQEFLRGVGRQQYVAHTTIVENGWPNTPAPKSSGYFVVTRSCSVNLGYVLAKFHTWADIRVGYYDSYHWIDSVLNTRTGLTGVTTGVTLTNTYSYAYNQSASSVSVKGGGIVNIYLLIDGGIRLYSVPVSCSFTYRVY